MHKQQGWLQAWEYCQLKPIQRLGRASQGVNWSWSHQESPRSDIFRKRATKPLLKQKHHQKHLTWTKEKKNWTVVQWSKVLFWDESKFSILFGNQGPRVWRKSGEEQKTVWSPQSVMIWAAMSSVFSEVHSQRSHLPGNVRALHASFCWQALWRCWFPYPAGFGWSPPCHAELRQ